jgi:hypothetical protein
VLRSGRVSFVASQQRVPVHTLLLTLMA